MHNYVKGALAVSAAGALLLGGAGTLAYWNDSEAVAGSQITSGRVELSPPDCDGDPTGTHGWQLDDGTPFIGGTTEVVPGDTVTKVCSMTLTIEGSHVGATLAMDDTGALSADPGSTLEGELAADATFTVDSGAYAPITDPGVYAVLATVRVTFDGTAASNGSQNGDVALDAITLVATQTHQP